MGAFFGSVHLRTADRPAVLLAVEAIAKSKKSQFLVSPPLRGWVAVYPIDQGQDQRLAATVAKRVGGDAVWVCLHDDDVFAYAVWRDGKLVDEYNSCPDYFGDVSPAIHKRSAGQPHLFKYLLPAGTNAEKVKWDLNGDATSQLMLFAANLDLTNPDTSYDYLMAGETEGVAAFDQFIHVPDRGPEIAARKKLNDAAEAALKRSRDAGLLLCDLIISSPDDRLVMSPVLAAGSGDRDFLYALPSHGAAPRDSALMRLVPPFSMGPSASGIQLSNTPYKMLTSPSGRYLAVGHAAGHWATEVWNLPEQRRLFTLPQARAAEPVAFDPAEESLLSLSEGTLTLAPLDGGAVRELNGHPATQAVCVHPADGTVVSGFSRGGLLITDLRNDGLRKRLDISPASIARLNADFLQRSLATLKENGVNPTKIRAHEQSIREYLANGSPILNSEGFFRLRFTPDGRFLISASSNALRVYEWKAILAETEHIPAPLHEVPAETFEHEFHRQKISSTGPIYDVICLADSATVLFSENSGVVRALDLISGAVRDVVRPPIPGAIWKILLSRDGSLLAFAYRPTYEDATDKTPYRIQIWDLNRLLGQKQ